MQLPLTMMGWKLPPDMRALVNVPDDDDVRSCGIFDAREDVGLRGE